MSKKYIDREKVETWLLTETMCLDTDPDREYVVEKLRQDVPNEKVEPVVYCEDCRDSEKGNGYFRCTLWNIWNIPPNSFCSFGERRREKP